MVKKVTTFGDATGRDSEDETHVEDTIAIKSEICVQELPKVPPLALALVSNTHTRI